jgi:CubicO group peptidase (beta-lactamase class C family)
VSIIVRRAVLLLVLAPCAVAAQDARSARIDSIFAAWQRDDAPGCAVGVSGADRLLYARGYGSANLDYRVPLEPSSVFYLASVSKQFTAAAVALAARQGVLSLDDDVRTWLPELRRYEAPITVRQLVHHTSGLRDYLTLMPLAGRRLQDVLSDAELIDLIARQRALNFAPGTEFLYSNTGYVLLAEIVRRATGKTLPAYAEEQIFRPLGMRDTHFHDDAGVVVPRRVIGYARDSSGYRINHFFNFDKVGDGGLYSTVEDLARWDRAMHQGAFGGPGFVAQLLERGVLASGDTLPYAFGVVHNAYRELRTVEHGGSLAGFRTALVRFPDAGLSVIVLCNDGRANAGLLARRVAEVHLADRMGPAEETRRAAAPRDTAAPGGGARDASHFALEPYAGTYFSEELGTSYALVVRDTVLEIVRPDRTLALRPAGKDTFVTAQGLRLRFSTDDAGRPVRFLVDAGRVRGVVFERTP